MVICGIIGPDVARTIRSFQSLETGILRRINMKKKNDLVWSLSLMVIGVVTFILAGSNIVGIELPDVAVRVLGIIDLIAIPFLALSTMKKIKKD